MTSPTTNTVTDDSSLREALVAARDYIHSHDGSCDLTDMIDAALSTHPHTGTEDRATARSEIIRRLKSSADIMAKRSLEACFRRQAYPGDNDYWDAAAVMRAAINELQGGPPQGDLTSPNPHTGGREAVIEKALADYDSAMELLGGCGDSNCVIKRPVGMRTNGGCRCYEDRIKARRAMQCASFLRSKLRALSPPLQKTQKE